MNQLLGCRTFPTLARHAATAHSCNGQVARPRTFWLPSSSACFGGGCSAASRMSSGNWALSCWENGGKTAVAVGWSRRCGSHCCSTVRIAAPETACCKAPTAPQLHPIRGLDPFPQPAAHVFKELPELGVAPQYEERRPRERGRGVCCIGRLQQHVDAVQLRCVCGVRVVCGSGCLKGAVLGGWWRQVLVAIVCRACCTDQLKADPCDFRPAPPATTPAPRFRHEVLGAVLLPAPARRGRWRCTQ